VLVAIVTLAGCTATELSEPAQTASETSAVAESSCASGYVNVLDACKHQTAACDAGYNDNLYHAAHDIYSGCGGRAGRRRGPVRRLRRAVLPGGAERDDGEGDRRGHVEGDVER
jgi:hypothetical protein